ncbi:MAG: DUF5343 domain-containing protein, partial [Candidatus Cyclobacteriaceae bacterium M2_1C_046]
MGISENFLVNTKSFDPIIEALISLSEQPETISDTTLEKMGYDNPSDLLVLHVLRGLDIINQDKTPGELYYKMVDPDHTKEAIAEGVIKGYEDLFHQNYEAHKLLPGELQEELKDYFDGKKTDLIIKYIANTFHKLVSYAGLQNVEKARDKMLGKEPGKEKETEKEFSKAENTVSEAGNNGNSSPDYRAAADQEEISSRSIEEILFGDKRTESEEDNADSSSEKPSSEASTSEAESDTKSASDEDIKETNGDTIDEQSESESEPELESRHESGPEPSVIDEEVSQEEPEKEAIPKDESTLSNLNMSDKRVQKAFVKRGELQYKLERFEDALESSEEIIAYFDDAEEEFLKKAVSNAVIRRVKLVKKLGQDHKLLPALNEVIRRFANADKPEYYEQASKAMLQKAELLESRDYDRQDLLPLYNSIIDRLEHETDPYVQEKVNEIFIRRLKLLNRADDKSEFL